MLYDGGLDEVELRVALEEAMQDLSPRQRQVMALTIYGYKQREIARGLGIAPRTVREYLSIARDRLRRTLLNSTSNGL